LGGRPRKPAPMEGRALRDRCGQGTSGAERRRSAPPSSVHRFIRNLALPHECVEAGERLVLAIGGEPLAARHETVGSEYRAVKRVVLEGTTGGAIHASIGSADEDRVGAQVQDVVDA